jgi:hypothetical protein
MVESSFIFDSWHLKLIQYFACDDVVTIPSNTKILCLSRLSNCGSFSWISFENDPQLRRFESAAFAGTRAVLVLLLEKVLFIAGDPFPRSYHVRITNLESCWELTKSNEGRECGPAAASDRLLSGKAWAGMWSDKELQEACIYLSASRLNVWPEALDDMTGWSIIAGNVIVLISWMSSKQIGAKKEGTEKR